MADLAFDRYRSPAPLAYHRSVANLLERRDPDLWKWFASDAANEQALKALRLELLKRTYRLDRDTHAHLYADADEIAQRLELGAEVTLYQAEGDLGRGAALYFEPGRAHVVFGGDVIGALEPAEMRFVLGHELAHHKLWTVEEGRVWTVERLLRWARGQSDCATPYLESARLCRLYTEVFADRAGLWAVGDLEPSLRALLKVGFGLDDASGAAYLAQAEEVLSAPAEGEASPSAGGESGHPESFVRAALLAAWAHDPAAANARARALIESAASLDRLDLLGQERVADLTHWMLFEFLTEPWSERDLIRAHARALSPRLADALDSARAEPEDIDRLRNAIATSHRSVREYLAYLLLDFVAVDPEIDDVMLAAALLFAGDFDLVDVFKAVAARELKTTKTKLAHVEKNAVQLLAKAELSLGGGARQAALAPVDDLL